LSEGKSYATEGTFLMIKKDARKKGRGESGGLAISFGV